MKLTDVSFSYGEKKILDHFSLELPDSGATALTGPSGCGKTTLLRLLAGLEHPRSGRIQAPARTAFLFQENRLLPNRTAAGQIAAVMPRGADPMPWLKLVGLEADADALPEALSGGMQRRVALARCMAYGADRELLLLDEPFTGMDAERIALLAETLSSIRVPIVYAAHGTESMILADHIVRLDGIPLHVLDPDPKQLYV